MNMLIFCVQDLRNDLHVMKEGTVHVGGVA